MSIRSPIVGAEFPREKFLSRLGTRDEKFHYHLFLSIVSRLRNNGYRLLSPTCIYKYDNFIESHHSSAMCPSMALCYCITGCRVQKLSPSLAPILEEGTCHHLSALDHICSGGGAQGFSRMFGRMLPSSAISTHSFIIL